MTLTEYLESPEFQTFLDETLRQKAIWVVDNVLHQRKKVKRHQLYSIPAAIQSGGLTQLKDLSKNQKEKNTNSANQAFWTVIDELLSPRDSPEYTLYNIVRSLLQDKRLIEDESAIADNTKKKQIRKRNKDIIEGVMDQAISVYFEHVVCHYFFITETERNAS